MINSPCAFLRSMHLVVAGPTTARLARPDKKMPAMGTRTPQRFSGFSRPETPPMEPAYEVARVVPGYVRAMTTGRAVCMEK